MMNICNIKTAEARLKNAEIQSHQMAFTQSLSLSIEIPVTLLLYKKEDNSQSECKTPGWSDRRKRGDSVFDLGGSSESAQRPSSGSLVISFFVVDFDCYFMFAFECFCLNHLSR